MMSNRLVDPLFQLIKSLEKAEKRHFKLYIKRNSAKEDLKVIQLFDAVAALPEYDERLLLKKLTSIEKPQLANLKTHLYKQVLASLRLLKSNDSVDLQLHEQLDHARILYSKGLYHQSLKILDKAKLLAQQYHQDSFLIQIISLEKKIETLTDTNPTDRLVMESLIQRGPLSPSELAEAVQITPAAMTASVDRLIEMGHVNRKSHPTDRRKLVINASEASVAIIMNELLAMVVDVNSVLKDFTEKEMNTITRFLEQVNAAYSRHAS